MAGFLHRGSSLKAMPCVVCAVANDAADDALMHRAARVLAGRRMALTVCSSYFI
jgi:hypothetical protein